MVVTASAPAPHLHACCSIHVIRLLRFGKPDRQTTNMSGSASLCKQRGRERRPDIIWTLELNGHHSCCTGDHGQTALARWLRRARSVIQPSGAATVRDKGACSCLDALTRSLPGACTSHSFVRAPTDLANRVCGSTLLPARPRCDGPRYSAAACRGRPGPGRPYAVADAERVVLFMV